MSLAGVLLGLACSVPVRGQISFELEVLSVSGIPDTVTDGASLPIQLTFRNTGGFYFQGDVLLMLQFPDGPQPGPIAADTVNSPAAMLIAPQASFVVEGQFTFAAAGGRVVLGDNVVVVWPRIGPDGGQPPQEVLNPDTIRFTLIEPNGIREEGLGHRGLTIYPNPADGLAVVHRAGGKPSALTAEVQSLTGGRSASLPIAADGSVDTSALSPGLYGVRVCDEGGVCRVGRLLVSR